MDACHYTFAKIHERCNAKNDLRANYGLWVIMLCQSRFISCEKCTTLVPSWGAYASVGGGDIWEPYVLSAQLCCEPQTALKNKAFICVYTYITKYPITCDS